MAYVRKIMAHDEKLIGIARLHWIYVLKGLTWFLVMASAGWAMDAAMTQGLFFIARSTGADAISGSLMSLSNGAMLFMMAGGFFIFMLFVIKVLFTEVGLSNRRMLLKEGMFFVKVKQVDLEEVRGENMDLGYLGRILGYAYILLDCRFIGDVRIPAIEYPERFMRALHQARGVTADTLSVAIGRNNPVAVGVVSADNPDTPQPNVPAPTPEITPGEQPLPEANPPTTPGPEIRPTPVPHAPPAPMPSQQPETAPPQPTQPIPPPFNPEPPLQPPTGVQQQRPMQQSQAQTIVPPVVAQNVSLGPDAMAQVIQQVMPQMAAQVVKEMTAQGLIHPEEPKNDEVDTDLIHSFDDARLDKDEHGNDMQAKLEHAIH